MIIDAHAHFEPRMLDLEAMIRKLDGAGVDRVVLIPPINDPLPETPRALLSVMRKLMQSRPGRLLAERVHRATLTPEGDLRLSGRTYQLYHQPDNAALLPALRAHPGRFLGWIFLNPRNNPRVLDELERFRQERGFVGVKLHPHWHDYRTELLWPLLRRVEELRLPALIHLGFGARGDYRALCERFPRLTLISAHAGMPFFQDLWRFARDHRNLYVDLSSPYLDEALARKAVAALGPERCLYGTDAPYGFHEADESYDYRAIQGWVLRMPLTSAQTERIFADNIQEILAGSGQTL